MPTDKVQTRKQKQDEEKDDNRIRRTEQEADAQEDSIGIADMNDTNKEEAGPASGMQARKGRRQT